jgi:hypothetical protein
MSALAASSGPLAFHDQGAAQLSASTLTANGAPDAQFEELAVRESDGIRVSLLWRRGDENLKVAVTDLFADMEFELEVGSAPPLDVFYHPYAYQANRETSYHAELPCLEAAGAGAPGGEQRGRS